MVSVALPVVARWWTVPDGLSTVKPSKFQVLLPLFTVTPLASVRPLRMLRSPLMANLEPAKVTPSKMPPLLIKV